VLEQFYTHLRIRRVWIEAPHSPLRKLFARGGYADEIVPTEPCCGSLKPDKIARPSEVENVQLPEIDTWGNLWRINQIDRSAIPSSGREYPRPAKIAGEEIKHPHPNSPFLLSFATFTKARSLCAELGIKDVPPTPKRGPQKA
jgi:hypothetical protein